MRYQRAVTRFTRCHTKDNTTAIGHLYVRRMPGIDHATLDGAS